MNTEMTPLVKLPVIKLEQQNDTLKKIDGCMAIGFMCNVSIILLGLGMLLLAANPTSIFIGKIIIWVGIGLSVIASCTLSIIAIKADSIYNCLKCGSCC